jgi:hypothetical protein
VQLLQGDLDTIKRENIELERDIAEAQSLDRLQSEAIIMGFTRSNPSDVEYLIIPNYPPTADTTAAQESAEQSEPVESMLEALWLAIQNSIGDLIHGESP